LFDWIALPTQIFLSDTYMFELALLSVSFKRNQAADLHQVTHFVINGFGQVLLGSGPEFHSAICVQYMLGLAEDTDRCSIRLMHARFLWQSLGWQGESTNTSTFAGNRVGGLR
jgi:hypothetical protein